MPISHPYNFPITFNSIPMATKPNTHKRSPNFTNQFSPNSRPYLNPNPNSNFFNFSPILQLRIRLASPNPRIRGSESNFDSVGCNVVRLASSNSRVFETESNFDSIGCNFVSFVRSILPGGDWWSLRDGEVGIDRKRGGLDSVGYVLWRIWGLIGGDGKWVVFVGFASLVVAAMSEISMPSLLAACIFSAQNGDKVVFYEKSRILILLCLTSGLSRSSIP